MRPLLLFLLTTTASVAALPAVAASIVDEEDGDQSSRRRLHRDSHDYGGDGRGLRHGSGGSSGGGWAASMPPPPPKCSDVLPPNPTNDQKLFCFFSTCVDCYAGDVDCNRVLGNGCHPLQHCYDHGEDCEKVTDGNYLCNEHKMFCDMESNYVTRTIRGLLPEKRREEILKNAVANNKGSSSGDPHFKTWTGDKYDYHGECDLVLLDHPSFNDGQGLRVHIRTTRVKYFSFIEKVALQIGDEILEFDNDVENFLINGVPVEANRKHHKTMFAGYVIRRDPKAISVRLADGTGQHQDTGRAKIDFHMRKNGFPAVIVDAGHTDLFKGSLGLLGEWGTGRKLARDGSTVIDVPDASNASEFALEWQVRDTEPMIFQESRFPQFPTTCAPPAKMVGDKRLGASQFKKKEAEEACAHWEEDMEDCIFDVMATRDALVAEEGHIVHIE